MKEKFLITLMILNIFLTLLNFYIYFKYSVKVIDELTEINQALQDLNFIEYVY